MNIAFLLGGIPGARASTDLVDLEVISSHLESKDGEGFIRLFRRTAVSFLACSRKGVMMEMIDQWAFMGHRGSPF